jgi:hypothetical protein|eukprot:102034-Prymnesium_polylepis.1
MPKVIGLGTAPPHAILPCSMPMRAIANGHGDMPRGHRATSPMCLRHAVVAKEHAQEESNASPCDHMNKCKSRQKISQRPGRTHTHAPSPFPSLTHAHTAGKDSRCGCALNNYDRAAQMPLCPLQPSKIICAITDALWEARSTSK